MNTSTEQAAAAKSSSEPPSAANAGAVQTSSAKYRGGLRLVLLLTFLLIAVAAVWWYKMSTQPKRILDQAIQYLQKDQFDELLLELTKLEGLPEYDLHRKVLRGAMYVKQKRYSDADDMFEYLPDDERLQLIGRMHEGIARFNQHRLQNAIDNFQKALELEPDNRDAREWLAKTREQLKPDRVLERGIQSAEMGDWKSFEELTETLRDQEDAQNFYQFMTGLIQLNQGDLANAVKSFNKSKEEPALREESLLRMAGAYASLGMIQEAESKYMQVLEVNDVSIPAHTWLAAWFHDQGAIDFAAVHLRKLAELQPDNPRPNRLLGLSAREMRDYKQAIAEYREALKRPNLAPYVRQEVLVELADCLVHEKEYDAALEALNDKALNNIAADPVKVQREVLLADCFTSEGDVSLALAHLERGLAINSTDLDTLIAKGGLLQVEGNLPEAILIFEKAVKHYPKDYTAQFKLSQAYLQNGDKDASQKHAELAEAIKRLYDKKTDLNRVAAADAGNAEVRYQLGLVALELNDPKLAGFWFNSAVTIDPNHFLARAELGKLVKPPSVEEQLFDDKPDSTPKAPADKTKTEQEQE